MGGKEDGKRVRGREGKIEKIKHIVTIPVLSLKGLSRGNVSKPRTSESRHRPIVPQVENSRGSHSDMSL